MLPLAYFVLAVIGLGFWWALIAVLIRIAINPQLRGKRGDERSDRFSEVSGPFHVSPSTPSEQQDHA